MSQIKEDPASLQTKTPSKQNNDKLPLSNRQGQGSSINDIFEVMQKNFDETFNDQNHEQIPKLLTEQITAESSKQIIHSSRSGRKVKPIYSTVAKKQSSPNQQNPNSERNSNSISNNQKQNPLSGEKQSPNAKGQSSESGYKNNKSSPYTKIMGRLHHSMVSEFNSHQEHPTSIQNLQDQRNYINKTNEGSRFDDKSPNHAQKPTKVLNYQELQQKIESALKKSSHYKAFTSSRLNKSNLTSRTFNEFNEMLLNRFDQYDKNRERQIQQKKLELQEINQKQLKFHPKINKKSIQFVQQMGGHQTLQNRYQKIIELKNKKLQQYQEQRKQKKEEEYEQFMEQFLKHQKTPQQNTRSYDKFYEEMFKWKQRSIKNTQEKKKIMEENQLKDTNNFNPKINKKSTKIVMNSTKSQKHLAIHQRQIPGQRRFKSKIDEECTFKPKVNKRKVK